MGYKTLFTVVFFLVLRGLVVNNLNIPVVSQQWTGFEEQVLYIMSRSAQVEVR